MAYPYWNGIPTHIINPVVQPQTEYNHIQSWDYTTPTINSTFYDQIDDTKPDITDLLSDIPQDQENISYNNDDTEWIDVTDLQVFLPGDDATRARENEPNQNVEKTVQNQPNAVQSHKENQEHPVLKETNQDIEEQLEGNKEQITTRRKRKQITTLTFEDTQNDDDEDVDEEWVEESVEEEEYDDDSRKTQRSLIRNGNKQNWLRRKRKEQITSRSYASNNLNIRKEESKNANEEWVRKHYTPTSTNNKDVTVEEKLETAGDSTTNNKGYHRGGKRFSCQQCNYVSKKNAHLARHIYRRHTPADKIRWKRCDTCDFQTKTFDGLQHHYLSKRHTHKLDIARKKLPFQWHHCETCGFKTTVKDAFDFHFKNKKHMDVVFASRQKTVNTEERLNGQNSENVDINVEKEVNTGRNKHKCYHCGLIVSNSNILTQHIFYQHSPADKIKWYKCEICNYKAKLNLSLQVHFASLKHKKQVRKRKLLGEIISEDYEIEPTEKKEKTINDEHLPNEKIDSRKHNDVASVSQERSTLQAAAEKSNHNMALEEIIEATENAEENEKRAQAFVDQNRKENLVQAMKQKQASEILEQTEDQVTGRKRKRQKIRTLSFENSENEAMEESGEEWIVDELEEEESDDNEETGTQIPRCRKQTLSYRKKKTEIVTEHTYDKPNLFSCTVCGYKTSKNFHLKRHYATKKHIERMEEISIYDYQTEDQVVTRNDEDDIAEEKIEIEENVLPKNEETEDPRNNDEIVVQQTAFITLYMCNLCRYQTRVKTDLQFHLQSRKHQSAVEEKENSNRINDEKQRYGYLPQHIVRYRCDTCNYVTTTNHNLQIHYLSQKHINAVESAQKKINSAVTTPKVATKKERYKCKMCDFTTTIRECVDFHFNKTHMNASQEKTPNSETELHRRNEDSGKAQLNFLSPRHEDSSRTSILRQLITTVNNLNGSIHGEHCTDEEMNFAKPKNFKCRYCYYPVESELDLKIHILENHSRSRAVMWHTCSTCNFRTRMKSSFQLHVISRNHKDAVSANNLETQTLEAAAKEGIHNTILEERIEATENIDESEEIVESRHSTTNKEKLSSSEVSVVESGDIFTNNLETQTLEAPAKEDIHNTILEERIEAAENIKESEESVESQHSTTNKEKLSSSEVSVDISPTNLETQTLEAAAKEDYMILEERIETTENIEESEEETVQTQHPTTNKEKLSSSVSVVESGDISQTKNKCNICHRMLKNIRQLRKHISVKHVPAHLIKWHSCDICNFKAKLKYNLQKHFQSQKHKDAVLRSKVCEESIDEVEHTVTQSMLEEKEKDCSLQNQYNCGHCDYVTQNETDLVRHISEEHQVANKPLHKIEESTEETSNSYDWTEVNVEEDPNENEDQKSDSDDEIKAKFKCSHCKYKTNWKNNMTKHVISKHTPSDQIQWLYCAHCPYKAKTKEYLYKHWEGVHNKLKSLPWVYCDKCTYKTKLTSTLKEHIITNHTRLEDIKWFTCDECPYRSKVRGQLYVHAKARHRSTWFYCDKCHYKTIHRKSLKKHRKTHDKLRRVYRCKECPHQSYGVGSIKEHILSVHQVDDLKITSVTTDIIVPTPCEKNDCFERIYVNGKELVKCVFCHFFSDVSVDEIDKHVRKSHNLIKIF